MAKGKLIQSRVSDGEKELAAKLAKHLECTESELIRLMLNQFAIALGHKPGKPTIRVTVEHIGELPY